MKNQENPNWYGEKTVDKCQWHDTDPEIIWQKLKSNYYRNTPRSKSVYTLETNGKTESLSKETGYIKGLKDIWGLKNTITK